MMHQITHVLSPFAVVWSNPTIVTSINPWVGKSTKARCGCGRGDEAETGPREKRATCMHAAYVPTLNTFLATQFVVQRYPKNSFGWCGPHGLLLFVETTPAEHTLFPPPHIKKCVFATSQKMVAFEFLRDSLSSLIHTLSKIHLPH